MLLLGTGVAWVRSYFVSDSLTWTSQKATILGAGWGSGKFDLVSARSDPKAFVQSEDSLTFEKPIAGWEVQHTRPPNLDDWSLAAPEHEMKFLGAKFRSGKVLFMYVRDLTLPMWMLVIVFGIGPMVGLARRWRRRGPGYCAACGYDIRATPQRCPECGTEVGVNAVR
jgi:hypothetical protein